jgi:hypothetical protein
MAEAAIVREWLDKAYTRESAEQAFISAEWIAKVVRSQLHL